MVALAGLAVLLLLLFIDALNFMTLTAAVMPGETISQHQWLAVIISFIGVGLGADQRRGALGPGVAGAGSMIVALQHGTVTSLRTLKYSRVVYSAVIALLEVLELDRAWFELCDRELLDFTGWTAGQTVDEEDIKNFDVRMLAASTMPAPLAGMMPLDTPETIGAAQNFILFGALTYHR